MAGRPPKPRTTELGQFIWVQRRKSGLTMRQLAERARIPYKAISRLELSAHRPRSDQMMVRLAQALDVHPNELLERAALTRFLAPAARTESIDSDRLEYVFLLTQSEHEQVSDYLTFLRYLAAYRSEGTAAR